MNCQAGTKKGTRCQNGGTQVLEYLFVPDATSPDGRVTKQAQVCGQHKQLWEKGETFKIFEEEIPTPAPDNKEDIMPAIPVINGTEVDTLLHTAAIEWKHTNNVDDGRLHIGFTAHRDVHPMSEVKALFERIMEASGDPRPESIMAHVGGAAGGDRGAAGAAHALGIPFTLHVPEGYYDKYHSEDEWPFKLIDAAYDVLYTQHFVPSELVLTERDLEYGGLDANGFHWRYNHVRNAQLIHFSRVMCVVSPHDLSKLLKMSKGGTSNCVKTLKKAMLANPERWMQPIRVNPETGHVSNFPSF